MQTAKHSGPADRAARPPLVFSVHEARIVRRTIRRLHRLATVSAIELEKVLTGADTLKIGIILMRSIHVWLEIMVVVRLIYEIDGRKINLPFFNDLKNDSTRFKEEDFHLLLDTIHKEAVHHSRMFCRILKDIKIQSREPNPIRAKMLEKMRAICDPYEFEVSDRVDGAKRMMMIYFLKCRINDKLNVRNYFDKDFPNLIGVYEIEKNLTEGQYDDLINQCKRIWVGIYEFILNKWWLIVPLADEIETTQDHVTQNKNIVEHFLNKKIG